MYQLKLHKNLTIEKWIDHPFHNRILMIGNEVNRLKNAIENGQSEEDRLSCVERALELTDLTIACEKKRTVRRELLRWRELFCAYYLPQNLQKEKIPDLYGVLILMSSEAFNLLHA